MLVGWNPLRRQFEAKAADVVQYHRIESAGFEWSKPAKALVTRDMEKASRLLPWFDRSAWEAYEMHHRAREQARKASAAGTADLDVPMPAGLSYLPYQLAGIAYALNTFAVADKAPRGVLFADEMGLGKTVEAIGVVNALPDIGKVLIVAPASVRLNWVYEWDRWCVRPIAPVILRTSFDGITTNRALIVSYEGMKRWRDALLPIQFDLLIMDEAHRCKDTTTGVYKALLGRGTNPSHADWLPPIRSRRTLMLTGTPIINRPEEIFPLLRRLDPHGLGKNGAEFRARYSTATPQHLPELHDSLRARVMVRRIKADVLKELPPKRRQIVFLDVPNAGKAIAEELGVMQDVRKRLAETREQSKGQAWGAQVQLMTQAKGWALSEISRIRHKTALFKVPKVAEAAKEALESAPALLLFAHHLDVLDGLQERLGHYAVRLDGRMGDKEKNEAVRRFQDDDKIRVFLGSIRAAGQGITLTRASTVLFAELDWTPAAMSQAEDRAHRLGQKDTVNVHHLVLDGSIDAKMAQILIRKQAIIDAIVGGAEPPEDLKKPVIEEILA